MCHSEAVRYADVMGWRAAPLSPFVSERARSRAPQILAFAGLTGAAALVAPDNEIVLSSGTAADIDLTHVACVARMVGGGRGVVSFREGASCVHAKPVVDGWMLCIVSTFGVTPALVIDRLERASHVLALALRDGGGVGGGSTGSGPSGASAEVALARRRS